MKSLLNLVGISHRSDLIQQLVPALPDGTKLMLVAEPQNPHDGNALMVCIPIGYVKREQAATLAPKLRDYAFWDATIARNDGHYVELEIEEPSK